MNGSQEVYFKVLLAHLAVIRREEIIKMNKSKKLFLKTLGKKIYKTIVTMAHYFGMMGGLVYLLPEDTNLYAFFLVVLSFDLLGRLFRNFEFRC